MTVPPIRCRHSISTISSGSASPLHRDGKVYQLPDQQFANLYGFRYDLFRPLSSERFGARYGYELGVPKNWRADEDIAEFFTNDVREIDGTRV